MLFSPPRSSHRAAFSLVEVVLAMGVISFAMMAMLGTLPIGLTAMRESRGQITTANIVRHLQAELQQLSFSQNSSDEFSVQNLTDKIFYFSLDGTVTDETQAYYKASFSVGDVTALGLSVNPANGRSVTVTLSYPMSVSQNDRQTSTYSLLLAKQKTN